MWGWMTRDEPPISDASCMAAWNTKNNIAPSPPLFCYQLLKKNPHNSITPIPFVYQTTNPQFTTNNPDMTDDLNPTGPSQPSLNQAYTTPGNPAQKEPAEQAQSNINASTNTAKV